MRSLRWLLLLAAACNSSSAVPVDGGAGDLSAPADLQPPLAPLTTPLACADAIADVYVANSALPAYLPGDHGKIVRCAVDKMLTAADVLKRATAAGYRGPALGSGAQALRVAYRTERLAGQGGVGTAEIYLPSAPLKAPAEAVVAVHGTIGLADACAPSRLGGIGSDAMAMPLVGAGMAVIAPDYAALGDGAGATYQGWDLAEDEAHSVLDAARALRAVAPPSGLTTGMVLVGHSQGGGAVFAAQALARSYGAELHIDGVVAFAPGWYDRREWATYLGAANRGAATGGNAQYLTAFAAMYFFGHGAVYDGVSSASNPFAAGVQSRIKGIIDGNCLPTLGSQLAAIAPTVGDLYDAAFAASVEACNTGGTCTAPGQNWITRMSADRPPLDSAGAPVLVIQGLNDALVVPQATACTMARLQTEQVNARACTDATADHLSVVGANATLAIQFIEARLSGGADLPCTNGLPTTCPNP